MSVPLSLMASDPNADLVRRIIEARICYERLCGIPPTIIYVNGPIKIALATKGYADGKEVAGMKVMSSPESIADQAICSRDADLFMFDKPVVKAVRGKGKK